MSFYVKLFLFVISASVVAYFAINRFVKSTDHMPDTFSTTTTSYLERDADELVVKPEPVAVREKSDIELEIEKERSAVAEAALERKELRMLNEENSLRKDKLSDEEALLAEQDAEEEVEEGEGEETDDSQTAENEESSDSGSTTEQSRSDSDADIKAQIEANDTDAEAIDPTDMKLRIRKNGNETLKTKKRDETVQALDLAYAPPAESNCTFPDNNVVRVSVSYRPSSYAIKGHSLTNIDKLVRLYKKCGGGKMLVLDNIEGLEDTEERLIQLRKDEVKYYLLQRRVPKDDMIFSDNS